jgi:acyl carrier protein
MKKNEFANQLAEYCEFESQEYTLDTILKTISGYDSLAIMSMIAFIDENFNMKLTAHQLQELTDFNSIILLIGEEKFEND